MHSANKTENGDHARGDLGRRAARRRAELGLSVEEVARRAEMAPGYVVYLEQHPPNLTPWALARLARALELNPDTLLGADTEVPPGHDVTFGRAPSLQPLEDEESMDLLRPGGVGRIAFCPEGEAAPTILPVNFAVVEGKIVFRTRPEGAIARGAAGREVAFQVDRLDGVMSQGWSVLAKGTARLVEGQGERDDLAAVPVHPWAGGERDTYMVVVPTELSGRRVRSGEVR